MMYRRADVSASNCESGAIAINVLIIMPVLLALTFSILQMGLWGAASLVVRAAAAQAVTDIAYGVAVGDSNAPAVGTAIGNADVIIRGVGFIRNVRWSVPEESNGVVTVRLEAHTVDVIPTVGFFDGIGRVRASDHHSLAPGVVFVPHRSGGGTGNTGNTPGGEGGG